jgi:LCP family protein required for cell wall assembly
MRKRRYSYSSHPLQNQDDPWAKTRPQQVQPDFPDARLQRWQSDRPPQWMRRRRRTSGCIPLLIIFVFLGLATIIYLFAPLRTNILLLGIDYTPWYSAVGRSDTIILCSIIPSKPYVGMLSIPRDLWVEIPGIGENRINTAHFFAEAQNTGSGPAAALQTVRQNFGVSVNYFIRVRFDGFKDVVNALGGVDITLDEPAAGYLPGKYHLTGSKALAFARQRLGSDDFFRMQNGQLLMKSIFKQMLNPLKWPRIPAVLVAMARSLDTNLPVWQWPRLLFAVLRAGPDGIDNRTISREMVVPFTTSEGAEVLAPDWNAINPVLLEMFGQ